MNRTAFPDLTALVAHFGIPVHLPLPVFGLCLSLAFLTAIAVLRNRLQARVRSGELGQDAVGQGTDMLATSVVVGLAGAKLFSLLETPGLTWATVLPHLVSGSGFTVYGGLICGSLCFVAMARRYRLPVLVMLDAIAPAYLLAYALGRLGCQLAGDGDWGIASDLSLKPDWLPNWLWSQQYVGNVLGVELPSPGVYPTPLYEALMALLSGLCLARLRFAYPGQIFGWGLVLVAAERLLIESIRVNIPYHIGPFAVTQAQLLSVPILLIGVVFVVFASRWQARTTDDASVVGA